MANFLAVAKRAGVFERCHECKSSNHLVGNNNLIMGSKKPQGYESP